MWGCCHFRIFKNVEPGCCAPWWYLVRPTGSACGPFISQNSVLLCPCQSCLGALSHNRPCVWALVLPLMSPNVRMWEIKFQVSAPSNRTFPKVFLFCFLWVGSPLTRRPNLLVGISWGTLINLKVMSLGQISMLTLWTSVGAWSWKDLEWVTWGDSQWDRSLKLHQGVSWGMLMKLPLGRCLDGKRYY